MKKMSMLAIAAVSVLTFSACGSQADEDRSGGKGNQPDTLEDATNVTLYRNADNVPNVAYFCAGKYGWASTLSGTDSAGSKGASLVRFPDYDIECGGGVPMEGQQ